jgi:hypothetical protein
MPWILLVHPSVVFAHLIELLIRRGSARAAGRLDGFRCDACAAPTPCPLDWRQEGPDGWSVDARCGACGDRRRIWLSNGQAARLDIELDTQMTQIREAADALARERVRDEFGVLIAALHLDLIGPDDFADAPAPAPGLTAAARRLRTRG